jgi:putative DNA primase/helicase
MTAQVSVSLTDLRVPDDLTELDQWVLWRYEQRNDRPTKVPYQVSGDLADSTDPATWASFEDALNIWHRNRRYYVGLGFVFSKGGGLAGVDLDDALDAQGEVKPWARGIVERFGDTYTEISPSGEGLKIWVRGSLPANLGGVKVGDGAIEMYDHARYFALTGLAFRGAPLQVEDHAADLLSLYERLTASRTAGGKGWPLQPMPGGRIPYGRQHNILVSICGTLRARGVCDEAIEACLQIVNQKQCERPGPLENIARIVRSSRRWATK